MLRLTDRAFHYTNSAKSSEPNYLKNKFDKIIREQRKFAEAEKAKPVNVRVLKELKK